MDSEANIILEVQYYVELEDIVHMAITVEKQLSRKNSAWFEQVSSQLPLKSN